MAVGMRDGTEWSLRLASSHLFSSLLDSKCTSSTTSPFRTTPMSSDMDESFGLEESKYKHKAWLHIQTKYMYSEAFIVVNAPSIIQPG